MSYTDFDFKFLFSWDQASVMAECIHCEGHNSESIQPDREQKDYGPELIAKHRAWSKVRHSNNCALVKAVESAAEVVI